LNTESGNNKVGGKSCVLTTHMHSGAPVHEM